MDIIEVPIDDQILAQLDELVPIVSASEAVRELGITVTRETVARLALVRGLKDSNLAPPPPGAPTEVRATATGKVVKIQNTPYGPGHLVPHGWGA